MPTILPLHPTPTRNQSHAPTLAHLCPIFSGRTVTFFCRTVRALLPSAATVAHLHPPTCARAAPQLRIFTPSSAHSRPNRYPFHLPTHVRASPQQHTYAPACMHLCLTLSAPPPPQQRTCTRLSPVEPPLSSMELPPFLPIFPFSQRNCAPQPRTFTYQPAHEPPYSIALFSLLLCNFALG